MKKNNSTVLQQMKHYGLNPNAKRKTTFLTTTAICQSYTKTLQKKFTLLYPAMGIISKGKIMHYVLNIDYSAITTKKYIDSDKHNLRDKILKNANTNFDLCLKRFAESKKLESWKRLIALGEILYDYSYILGLYGGFKRLIDKDEHECDEILNFFGDIGKARNRVAHLYIEIDNEILNVYDKISKMTRVSKNLLYFISFEEMKRFAIEKKISQEFLEQLTERMNGLLFIYTVDESKEIITTDQKQLLEAEDLFEWKSENGERGESRVHGIAAFPGKVTGKAFLLHINNKIKIPKGSIIVTNMTVMTDARMIKQSLGVVTDEGGLLSHAAVLCRELKIPCIIGTKTATKTFKDGDIIEIDSNSKTVRKI